jgi:Dolichyl-phosphate-mannose-protein mannosyltransferase
MTSTQRAICLLAIVTFGFIARAATTGAPILDHHSWRQADTAMIARNFAESRLNPLYPQVDHRGALPVGYVATGFELQALLVALISKVTGFSPQVGRLLSVLWYVGSALLVFALTRSRYGDAAGLSAAFIYSFGFPLVLFVERAFLNEALLLFLSFAVLVAVGRRTHAGGRTWLLLAAAAMAVIGAVKPTFLIVAAGVFAQYIERDGRRGLLRLEPYVLVSCGIIAATLWLSWAASLGRTTGLTFGLTDKLFDAATLFDHGYWVKVTRRLVKDLFGPMGIIAATIGLVTAWRTRRLLEIALLLAGFAYLIIVTPGNYHHDYYQLPLVTGVTVLAGLGLTSGLDVLEWFRTRSPRTRLAIRVVAFWLLPITTLLRSASAHNWYEVDVDAAAFCNELRPALHGDDLVAFLSQQSPALMFCTGSRGWLIGPGPGMEDRLAAALRDGATVVVSPREAVHALAKPMLATDRIADSADFVAFRVTRDSAAPMIGSGDASMPDR